MSSSRSRTKSWLHPRGSIDSHRTPSSVKWRLSLPLCPAPCTALSVRCFCQWDCWAPWEGCPYSHQPCLAAARAAVIPAVQTLVHPLEKSFLLQGSPCGHYCLLSYPVSHSRVHSSIWLFGGLAHSSVFWNSQLCEWHIQLLQSTNMYSWVGCALHNSDFATCGLMHDCTMGRPSPCSPCRVPCSLSVSSLFPSLLNFNHLCLRAISALFPEPYPEVELPCRNHKSHASLSALLAPSVPAGPSGEPFVSWGLHLLACPQALFPPLAPLTAPFPQPGDLGRLPRPSGLRLLPQLPLSLISQVGSALPRFNSTWHARPPLPLLPCCAKQSSQALWPIQPTLSIFITSEAPVALDTATSLTLLTVSALLERHPPGLQPPPALLVTVVIARAPALGLPHLPGGRPAVDLD